MTKAPSDLDMSLLDWLQYGDLELIASRHREETGRKTAASYVWSVINKKVRNDRILIMAFEKALENRSKMPKQALKVPELEIPGSVRKTLTNRI